MAEEENGSTLPLQHLNELPTPRLFLHYLEDKDMHLFSLMFSIFFRNIFQKGYLLLYITQQ